MPAAARALAEQIVEQLTLSASTHTDARVCARGWSGHATLTKPSTLNPKPLTTCMRETCWVPTSPSMYIHRYF